MCVAGAEYRQKHLPNRKLSLSLQSRIQTLDSFQQTSFSSLPAASQWLAVIDKQAIIWRNLRKFGGHCALLNTHFRIRPQDHRKGARERESKKKREERIHYPSNLIRFLCARQFAIFTLPPESLDRLLLTVRYPSDVSLITRRVGTPFSRSSTRQRSGDV